MRENSFEFKGKGTAFLYYQPSRLNVDACMLLDDREGNAFAALAYPHDPRDPSGWQQEFMEVEIITVLRWPQELLERVRPFQERIDAIVAEEEALYDEVARERGYDGWEALKNDRAAVEDDLHDTLIDEVDERWEHKHGGIPAYKMIEAIQDEYAATKF